MPRLFVPAQRGRYERCHCLADRVVALLALAQAACLPSWLRFERFRHGGCWHDHEVAALDPHAGILVLHFGDVIEVPSGTIGVGEGWPYGVSSMPFFPTGVDDADEATQAGRCHRAAAWRDAGSCTLLAGGGLPRVRARMPRLALLRRLCSEGLCLRVSEKFILRPRFWLGNKSEVFCLCSVRLRITAALRLCAGARQHA